MRRTMMCVLGITLLCVWTACGPSGSRSRDGQGKTPLIGITKIVAHPALDAVEKGIQDELNSQGIKARYDLQNANNKPATAGQIAKKFKADRVDLAVGIATPSAQALANAFDETPVVFSAVTDPVGAGLVDSIKKGGTNITGVSDMTPVAAQIKLLHRLKPIKVLGHVYSGGESNAVALAEKTEAACKELGIKFVPVTVTKSSEVKQAARSIIDRVDAIYVSTDNTVISALSALADVAAKAKKPVMSADPSSAEKHPVLAAWGFDYYQMGRETGRMIGEILSGKAPRKMPTRFMTAKRNTRLLLNLDVAKSLGITVPESLIADAAVTVRDGKVTKRK